MRWYDLYVRAPEPQTVELARRLGWSGLGMIGEQIAGTRTLDVAQGVEIETTQVNELSSRIRTLRPQVPLVVVRGTSPDISRAAVETPEVDMLHLDCTQAVYFDQVMARLARKNSVAILFPLAALRHTHGAARADVFAQYLQIARLVQKSRAPFALSSGALAPWDLCSPPDLISFGRLLGFKDSDIRKSLSGGMLAENRKRLSGKWIMPGVEVV